MIENKKNIIQEELKKAEKNLRINLLEFSETPEIQAQITEAYYIWRDDTEHLINYTSDEELDDETFSKFYDWFIFDFKLFDSKERVVERFYEVNKNNLNKMEKDILENWIDSVCSFYEVREIKPLNSCRINDLFTHQHFLVKDSSASTKNIKPGSIINARPLKVGSEYYFSGTISLYPSVFKTILLNFFNQEFKKYRTSFGKDKKIKDFLKDWGYTIALHIEDVLNHPQYITREGEEFLIATSEYKVNDRKKLVKKLLNINSLSEIKTSSEDIRIFSWEKIGKKILGANVEIEQDKMTIVCNSEKNLSRIKKTVKKELEDTVTHLADQKRKLESYVDSKKTKLPKRVNNKKELSNALNEYYENWLDQPISKLGGLTPRESVKTQGGRQKLEEVLKDLENIYENSRKVGEPYYDIKKLREKLLKELD